MTLPPLHIESVGTGAAVVFLHGGAVDSGVWAAQVPAFSARHRVVLIDARGYGRSPAPAEPYSPVEDVRDALDRAGIDRAAFVGSSAGGGVALGFALLHPERVASLVLASPFIPGFAYSPALLERLTRFATAYRNGGPDAVVVSTLADAFFPPRPGKTEARERLAMLLRRNVGALETRWNLLKMLGRDIAARLDAVRAPTLVLVGDEEDPDNAAGAAEAARRIPGARIERIARAGHLPHLDEPDAFNRAALAFLDHIAI